MPFLCLIHSFPHPFLSNFQPDPAALWWGDCGYQALGTGEQLLNEGTMWSSSPWPFVSGLTGGVLGGRR